MSAPATKVVHVKRAPYDEYIGRRMPGFKASIFGNRHRVGRDGTGEEVLAKYRADVLASADLLLHLPGLRGKTLGCWCKVKGTEPCHGDVLVDLLENKPEPQVLWKAAGGGTPEYSPALYKELMIAWGHLLIIGGGEAEDFVCRRRAFELWEDAGADPQKFLDLVNAKGERLRLKRGRELDAAAGLELYAYAQISTYEITGTRGNRHEAVNHRNGTVSRGVVCGDVARQHVSQCSFCGGRGGLLCDWPVGVTCQKCKGEKVRKETWYFMPSFHQIFPCYDCHGTGVASCSASVCEACARKKDGLDVCPRHRRAAGLPVTPPPDPSMLAAAKIG